MSQRTKECQGTEWDNPLARERSTRAAYKRRDSGRRRMIDPTTCDREYTAAELQFMNAMQAYKVKSGRMFPTWGEVLEVLEGLGYTKASA